jgi:hypothetical protein
MLVDGRQVVHDRADIELTAAPSEPYDPNHKNKKNSFRGSNFGLTVRWAFFVAGGSKAAR